MSDVRHKRGFGRELGFFAENDRLCRTSDVRDFLAMVKALINLAYTMQITEKGFELLQRTLAGGLGGLLASLPDDGCAILYRRKEGRFVEDFRSASFPAGGSYGFLEHNPGLLDDCLARGFSVMGGAECLMTGTRLYAVVDSVEAPLLLLLYELPDDSLSPDLVYMILSALPAVGKASVGRGLDPGLDTVVERVRQAGSPVLIQAEPGTDFEYIVGGIDDGTLVFEPGRLTGEVHLRELMGGYPGARLAGGHSVVPLVERGASRLLVYEPGFLSSPSQLAIVDFLDRQAGSLAWIFCTTMDLEKMVEADLVEEAFFELLNENVVAVSPLRSSPARIQAAVEAALDQVVFLYGRKLSLSEDALKAALEYGWPGNHAELRSTIFESSLLCQGDTLQLEDLRLGRFEMASLDNGMELRRRLSNLERGMLLEAYAMHSGNQVHMAKALGISRGSLQYKLEKFGLSGGH